MRVRWFSPSDPECINCGLPFKDRMGRWALDEYTCPWCGGRPKTPLEYIDSGELDDYAEL